MAKNKIGIKYEMYNAIVGSEIKALKAVEEPILMSASKQQTPPTNRSELMGILSVGWTYENVFENGKPLSRENAHASLETDAKILKSEMNRIKAIIATSKLVAAFDFVA
jgi:hypothetical protein